VGDCRTTAGQAERVYFISMASGFLDYLPFSLYTSFMKTSLEIPDELVREIKILAAREGRKLKDVVADSLRQTLARHPSDTRPSLRDLKPFSVGQIHPTSSPDRMDDMLHERGHRY